jgi:predicted ATPase/DNA-binding SARP family transcriptional activator
MLGPLRLVAEDGSAIDLGGARLRMLVARLALEPGQVVPTDALIDSLWGEAPPVDATNALQSLVSRLRRGLRAGNGTAVESHPAGYRLAVARENVDVYRFEHLAARGHDELRAGQPHTASATLRAALDLWRGPAMADVADAPFAGTATTRLTELRAAAVEDRVEADLALGRHQEVLPELRTLVAEQPLRERRSALLIKALYLSGRQADALAAYEQARKGLADELGVEPSAELKQVHLSVLRGEIQEGLPAKGSRLPARLTSFVGRQAELREVTGRLADNRLVTLVGPGGAGKTRLATEIAANLGGTTWFVELARVGESADVATAVLGALGLREVRMLESRPQVMEPLDRLLEALAGQHCLVVLDNCEHVITAAASLADTLLADCPGLRILATSREPLAITGETVFGVSSLDPPEAVRLFVDRAASAQPGFRLDDGNTETVTEICARLDGLPLALELAAARLRSMTLDQIAERLDDRFRLLTAGSRTSMPRHRTLRAVVEWSWELLEKPERILARRLSVFAAGATLESATAACADDELDPGDVLYVLSSLVEKSLVVVGLGSDGKPRYRMLETIRAYAAARLAEAGEQGRVHAAFDAYFLELAELADPHLRGPDQVAWLERLAADQDNLISAIRHAAEIGDADTAIRLTMATAWFWSLGGRQRDGISLASRVIELPGPAPAHSRATLRLFSRMGNEEIPDRDTIMTLREELTATDAMSHFSMLAMIEPMLAIFTGDREAANSALRRGLTHSDPWARAAAELGGAFMSENDGDALGAERHAVAALEAFRGLGDRWGQAMALGQLSERRTLRADHAGAIAAYEESLELVSQLGAMDDLPELITRLATVLARAGDLDGAKRELQKGFAVARERSSSRIESYMLCALSNVERQHGNLTVASELIDRAITVLTESPRSDGHWRAYFETTKAALDIATGDHASARESLCDGFKGIIELRDLPILATIGEWAAVLLAKEGNPSGAARLIGIGTSLRGTPDLGNVELNELIDRLKDDFGEVAYSVASLAGAALSHDEALAEVAVAIGVDESPPSS